MLPYDIRCHVFDKNRDGFTAMTKSVQSGRSLQYVQQTEVFNFNTIGENALYRAVCEEKPVAYIKKLIDEGADESARCSYGRKTPLLRSMSYHGPMHELTSFLQQTPNAPVDVGDRHGMTPLHCLVNYVRWTPFEYEMVYLEQLLRNGANPFRLNEYGYTAREHFMYLATIMKDPTKANAVADRLKVVEDSLVEAINHPRLIAVMMSIQERLGAGSPLSEINPDILRMIVDFSTGALMTPDDIGVMETEEVRGYVREIMINPPAI